MFTPRSMVHVVLFIGSEGRIDCRIFEDAEIAESVVIAIARCNPQEDRVVLLSRGVERPTPT